MQTWHTIDGQIVRRVLTGRSNAFLISNDSTHVLIDAGHANGYRPLSRSLAQLRVPQEGLTACVLTHAHYDHAENAHRIQERYATKLIIQQQEAGNLSRGENPITYGTTRFTRPLTNRFGTRVLSLKHYPSANPDITYDEIFDLNSLGLDAYLLHTPGHSVGSASVIVHHEIAIVGDAMFGVFPGSAFPPFADLPFVLIESWKKLLDTGCTLFLPAHGGAVTREVLQREYEKYHHRAKAFSVRTDQRPIL